MNRFEKAFEEWEKSLLILTAVLAAIFFLILFWPIQKEGSIAKTGNLPPLPNYIETEDLSYMQPPSLENIVNPMTFRKKLPVTQALVDKKVVQKKETPKQVPENKKETPKQVPENKKETPKQVPENKKETPKPPRIIDLTYRGLYKGLKNEPMAFILASDTGSKVKDSTFILKEGESVFELFKVLSFNEEFINVENLSLEDKDNNKTFQINRNKNFKFTIPQ